MSKARRYDLCILGSEASGKTCFIAGLAILGQVTGCEQFLVAAPESSESQEWLNSLARTLKSGVWPPASTGTRLYEFLLNYRGSHTRVSMLDYAGESFRRAYDSMAPESMERLREQLEQADTLLLLLDPNADLSVFGAPVADIDDLREQRLSALYNSILSLAHVDIEKGERLRKNVAVLVTKSDSLKKEDRALTPAALVERHAPKLYKTLRDSVVNLRCFHVSAIGGSHPGAVSLPGPPQPVTPTGYQELFTWIARSRTWAETCERYRRPARRLALAAGVVVAAAAALLALGWHEGGRLDILRDPSRPEEDKIAASGGYLLREGEARDLVNRLVDTRLQRIATDIGEAQNANELDVLALRLASLPRYKGHNRGDAVAEAYRALGNREQEILYLLAVNQTDLVERKRQAEEYRARYPQGVYAEEAARLVEEAEEGLAARQRLLIDKLPYGSDRADWAAALRKKADAVDAYRDKHGKPGERADMERAARLARALSAGERDLKVTIFGAQALADSYDSQVRITSDAAETPIATKSKSDATPVWNEEVLVKWRPGAALRVEWLKNWAYDSWSTGCIAFGEDKSMLSLGLLIGEADLRPGEKKDVIADNTAPRIKLAVADFDEDDMRVLRAYIDPGEFWKK